MKFPVYFAFLSKPGASPTGLVNVNPKNPYRSTGWFRCVEIPNQLRTWNSKNDAKKRNKQPVNGFWRQQEKEGPDQNSIHSIFACKYKQISIEMV